MKRLLILLFLFIASINLYSYNVIYLEQFYKLYTQEFYNYPHDVNRNIYYLKAARMSPFCNPLYALAKINDETEWEKYRYLMYTHINLKLVDSFLMLANSLDKQVAYFYNAPWKEQNIDSLNQAEAYYNEAKTYWYEAVEWAEKVNEEKFRFIHLDTTQYFEDESYLIMTGELDYEKIIDKHLKRLNKVRSDFEAMNERTY